MTKRLVDIDDDILSAAQAELGTETIKETVNTALDRIARARQERFREALDHLGSVELEDRSAAWR